MVRATLAFAGLNAEKASKYPKFLYSEVGKL